jgi:hypothetical protein
MKPPHVVLGRHQKWCECSGCFKNKSYGKNCPGDVVARATFASHKKKDQELQQAALRVHDDIDMNELDFAVDAVQPIQPQVCDVMCHVNVLCCACDVM